MIVNAATLLKGQETLNQQRVEIDQLVGILLGVLTTEDVEKCAEKRKRSFIQGNLNISDGAGMRWEISVVNRSPGGNMVWIEYGEPLRTLYSRCSNGKNGPQLEHVERTWSVLDHLVSGCIRNFPALRDRLEPLIHAAADQ